MNDLLQKQLEVALYLLGLNPYDEDLLSDVEDFEDTIKNYTSETE